LPTEAEFEAERASWVSNDAAGAFASPLKLVMAGYRSLGGSLYQVGSDGNYWSSSTEDDSYSRNFSFSSSSAGMNSNRHALGMSVRCIKD
jgi:uncharacterized protein (TIGR02145 family)